MLVCLNSNRGKSATSFIATQTSRGDGRHHRVQNAETMEQKVKSRSNKYDESSVKRLVQKAICFSDCASAGARLGESACRSATPVGHIVALRRISRDSSVPRRASKAEVLHTLIATLRGWHSEVYERRL
jgi:hypothetical protein